MKGETLNKTSVSNWIFRGYDKNDNEIESFKISDRTEREATNECMHHVEANSKIDDWSLMADNKTSVSESKQEFELNYNLQFDSNMCAVAYYEISKKGSAFWTAMINASPKVNKEGEALANAKRIVTAVNSYPVLLDALQSVLTTLKAMVKNDMIDGMIWVSELAIKQATNGELENTKV